MELIFKFLLDYGVNPVDVNVLEKLFLVLLLIPIVATIIGIARYVIGLRSINFYTPLFATFVFFDIANNTGTSVNFFTGLKYGLLFFICVFLTSTIFYRILKRLRMHYIPKLSLIITATTITIMIVLALMVLLERTLPLSFAPFLFIALIVSSEGFMAVYAKKNFKYTASIAFETLIITLISYSLISLDVLQRFVLSNPWAVLLLIVVNLYVGRFLGLRLTEYWRFKSILLNKDNIVDEHPKSGSKK